MMKKQLFINVVIVAFFLSILVVVSIGKNAIQLNRQGDAAIFEQIVDNIYVGKGAVSNVFANTQNYIESRYASKTTAQLFTENPPLPAQDERDMLKFHVYYILFPIALLKMFFTSSFALVLMQTVAFVGLIFSAFYFFRKESGSAAAAVVFSLFILCNPNWFIGIMGQFYPDRLFVLAGFLVCYALYKNLSAIKLFLLLIVVAAINERAALIAGIVVFAHSVLFFDKDNARKSFISAGMALLLLLLFYVEKTYQLENLYYNGFIPRGWSALMANLRIPSFIPGIISNIENNGALLFLALFSPRYLLIALAVMLPNLIGNIGGGEKVGWLTHYHSYYFPILVFAAFAGFLNLTSYFSRKEKLHKLFFAIFIVTVLIGNFVLQKHKNLNGYELQPFTALAMYKNAFKAYITGQQTGLDLREDIKKLIADTDLVATTELGMALLHDKVKITFFPLGVDKANKIFIPCADLNLEVDGQTMQESLNKLGFSLYEKQNENPIFSATSYCLLQK